MKYTVTQAFHCLSTRDWNTKRAWMAAESPSLELPSSAPASRDAAVVDGRPASSATPAGRAPGEGALGGAPASTGV